MRAVLALFLLLPAVAGAQSFVSMGRLFTTPSERTQLDQRRNAAPTLPAPVAPGVPAPGVPGDAASGGLPDGAGAVGGNPQWPGGAGAAGAAAGAEGSDQLRLDGVIRRSNGAVTVIVNGEVQPAAAAGNTRGSVRVDARGRSVTLKPGQRYDMTTGEIHEGSR